MEGAPFSRQNLHGTSAASTLVGPGRRKVEKNNLEPCFPGKQTQEVLSLTYISYPGRSKAEGSSGHGSEGECCGLNACCRSPSIALKAVLLGRPRGLAESQQMRALHACPPMLCVGPHRGLSRPHSPFLPHMPCVDGFLSQSAPEMLFVLEKHCLY